MSEIEELEREFSVENQQSDDPLYITEIAQLFLCGTSSWAINRIKYEVDSIAFGTFTFLLGHGLLGLIKYALKEDRKDKLRPIYRCSSFLTLILPLPLINTQIYLNYNQPELIAYSHAGSVILPLSAYLFKRKVTKPLVALVLLSNVCSLAYIGFNHKNYWALGLAGLAIWNEFGSDYLVENLGFLVPVDVWTSALSIFVIAAVKALENI